MSKGKFNYETAMSELKGIVQELQDEAVSLDDLEAKTERAIKLIRECKAKLRATEQKIENLFVVESAV